MTYSEEPAQYNVHSAVDEEQCLEMESKYGWTLVDVVPAYDPILKVDCVFEGEQTSDRGHPLW
jgi:hypothetical protein